LTGCDRLPNLNGDEAACVFSSSLRSGVACACRSSQRIHDDMYIWNIGVKKINQLAAKAREDLSNPLNGREYDLAIKGTINAFAQMLDWYDECFAELNQPKQDKVNQNN
jgi:hypothetical protein